MSRRHTRSKARPPRARRRFGQHFLAPQWAERVLTAIHPVPGDVFLEIGPGRGALTMPLAKTGAPILAVEIDRDLSEALRTRVPPNVTLLTGDILSLDVVPYLGGLQPQRPAGFTADEDVRRRVRIAGNLPYNISSPLLFWMIERAQRDAVFMDATIMLQREVADRLVARPGTKDYGVLTVLVRRHAAISRLLDLPPAAFTPAPKVRSSVVRLTFHPPSPAVRNEFEFPRMVKALFSQRRKMLSNALRHFDPAGPEVLARSGLDGRRRPETLQLEELTQLADLFASGTARTRVL
jgi:16S rRNA (adenine1518-N6/adenine1519-N6)-dimethyltransferase